MKLRSLSPRTLASVTLFVILLIGLVGPSLAWSATLTTTQNLAFTTTVSGSGNHTVAATEALAAAVQVTGTGGTYTDCSLTPANASVTLTSTGSSTLTVSNFTF